MSVSKMKKLTVVAPRQDADGLIRRLMRLGCVQIEEIGDGEGNAKLGRLPTDAGYAEDERRAARAEQAIRELRRYESRSRKKKWFTPPIPIDGETVTGGQKDAETESRIDEVLSLTERRHALWEERAHCGEKLRSLAPWAGFGYDPAACETALTRTFFGTLPAKADVPAMDEAIAKTGSAAVTEIVSGDKAGKYVLVLFFKEEESAISTVLATFGFSRVVFEDGDGTPDARMAALRKRQEEIDRERAEIGERLAALSAATDEMKAYADIAATNSGVGNAVEKLGATECTALLTGWVPAREAPRVASSLDEKEYAYEMRDPAVGEDAPVLLENRGFAVNFEWVLGMYAYPKYGKYDPTRIMGIFYLLIFGLMFADVGYGALLCIVGFGAARRLPLREGTRRSFAMFGYCGIFCMLWGVLLGSYFGDFPLSFLQNMLGVPAEALPNLALLPTEAATLALLFDPLENAMTFFVFSLAVGAVHLVTGMAVDLVLKIRAGKPWDALCDVVPYWLFFAGVGGILLAGTPGVFLTAVGVIAILLTQGRNKKGALGKLTGGLKGIYDLIGYASDLLSYSRILALGIAATAIGKVVNMLATMAGPTVGGLIMMVLIFLVGHVINLAINLLGTFVHTARLQYIEFFGKFFEEGGTPFCPLTATGKYTEVTPRADSRSGKSA